MKRLPILAFSAHLVGFFLTLSSPLTAQVCNVTANAGNDLILCAPGSTTLNGTATGGNFLTAAWTPTTGLSNAGILNPTANVSQTTTYQLAVRSLSPTNLITNGDFAVFDTMSFTSDYIYGTGGGSGLLSNEGQYALALNAGTTHTQFANCNDHGPGNNYMMVVNASGMPDAVWCQTITIEPNTEYLFGAWVTSVVSQNPAKLQFSANGTLLGNVFNASSVTCNWSQFNANWNSGSATSVEICIRNVNLTPAGNDFALDDITLQKICVSTDDVVVTVANLKADFDPSDITDLCKTAAAVTLNTLLDPMSTPGGAWTIDGTSTTVFDPALLTPGTHIVKYSVTLGPCTEEKSSTVTIFAVPNAGQAAAPMHFCTSNAQVVSLPTLINGEDPGGAWVESSPIPSTGSAFNAAAATFDATNQAPGTYIFIYSIQGQGTCTDVATNVTVVIDPSPTADAGADQSIDCTNESVTLGGASSSGLQYQWTAANGSPIANPTASSISVGAADIYTLQVTNTATGCSVSDQVTVTSNIASINASGLVTPITCDKPSSGVITINTPTGGTGPYTYALNGGSFQAESEFTGLAPGNFNVAIMDAFGCDTTLQFVLDAPSQISVALSADGAGADPRITLGDSIRLRATVNLPVDQIDTLIWMPVLPGCAGCAAAFVSPDTATTYTVTAIDLNGCSATASITIRIERKFRIFAPNAFSPNDDGINDLFSIHTGPEIRNIKILRIMDRWGGLLFEAENLEPNNLSNGWNGKYKEKPLNPDVYVFIAELETQDGEMIVKSGEVNLVR